jgi:hypothetical protein
MPSVVNAIWRGLPDLLSALKIGDRIEVLAPQWSDQDST